LQRSEQENEVDIIFGWELVPQFNNSTSISLHIVPNVNMSEATICNYHIRNLSKLGNITVRITVLAFLGRRIILISAYIFNLQHKSATIPS
jgi:hypothetical protein